MTILRAESRRRFRAPTGRFIGGALRLAGGACQRIAVLGSGAAVAVGLTLAAVSVSGGSAYAQDATTDETFVCDRTAYLSQGRDTTRMFDVQFGNGASLGIEFNPIGSGTQGIDYNALAYDPITNGIFALEITNTRTNEEVEANIGVRLVRIAKDGTARYVDAKGQVGLGALETNGIDGLLTNFEHLAGTFSKDGKYIVVASADGRNSRLKQIEIPSEANGGVVAAVDLGDPFPASVRVFDIATVGDFLYGVTGPVQPKLIKIDTDTGAITTVGRVDPDNDVEFTFGALFGSEVADEDGGTRLSLFGVENKGAGLFEFNLVTGEATNLIQGDDGDTTTVNDAANCPTVRISTGRQIDLSITKTNTPDQGEIDLENDGYVPGETRTYTMIARNKGPFASRIVAVDTLPSGITVMSADPGENWSCEITLGEGECLGDSFNVNAGTLARQVNLEPNAEATLQLEVKVDADRIGDLINKVEIRKLDSDIDEGDLDPSDNVAIDADLPPITLRKQLTGETGLVANVAEGGETLTYTLTLTNTGSQAVKVPDLKDQFFPAEVISSMSASNGGSSDPATGLTTWGDLTVPAAAESGEVGELQVTVAVTLTDTIPADVNVVGNLVYVGDPVEPPEICVPSDVQVCTPSEPPVLKQSKALMNESGALDGIAEAGETLTYEITIENVSNRDAAGYVVDDAFTPARAVASGGISSGNDNFTAGTINNSDNPVVSRWVAVEIPAGATVTRTIAVTLKDPLPAGLSEVTNAVIKDCVITDPSTGFPCNSVIATPDPQVNQVKGLSAESVTPADGIAEAGETLTYEITVTNTGSQAVSNYKVRDVFNVTGVSDIASVVKSVSSASAGYNDDFFEGVIGESSWTIPTLAAAGDANDGDVVVLTITVTMLDALPAGLTAVTNAVVDDCKLVDQVTGAPCRVTVETPPPAFELTKTLTSGDGEDDTLAESGETLTYTLTVANTSGTDAVDYTVNDRFTAVGVSDLNKLVDSVSSDDDSYNDDFQLATGLASWTIGELNANTSINLTYEVKLKDTLPAGLTEVRNLVFDEPPVDDPVCPSPVLVCTDVGEPTFTQSKALTGESITENQIAQGGETLSYTITVENTSNVDAENYEVIDRFSSTGVTDLTKVVASVTSPSAGFNNDFDPDTGESSWTIAELAAGETVELIVNVTLVPILPAELTDVTNAVIQDCAETDPATGAPCSVTTPTEDPQFQQSKSLTGEDIIPNSAFEPGETLTYTITIKNTTGTDAREDHVVRDQFTTEGVSDLRTVVESVTSPDDGFTDFDFDSGLSSWSVPASELEGNAVVTRTINVTLKSPLPEGLTAVRNAVPDECTVVDGVSGFPCDVVLPPVPAESDVTVTKRAELTQVHRGDKVPYVIQVTNNSTTSQTTVTIIDRIPSGFRYVEDTATIDGLATEPVVAGQTLSFPSVTLAPQQVVELRLQLLVLSSVEAGKHRNFANALDPSGDPVGPDAVAEVVVLIDPVFDCSEVIGKVFDDANRNGYQDEGELGLPGVRLATVRGLLVTTDRHGRFHVACADLPDPRIGSNFIMKLDTRTLPTGYSLTTENPRVVRLTAGKMTTLNFGVALGRVVALDLTADAFQPESTDLMPRWEEALEGLMQVLDEGPSIIRLGYIGADAGNDLVDRRLKALTQKISEIWEARGGSYRLEFETRVETSK